MPRMIDQVAPQFAFLIEDFGFSSVSERYSARVFGDFELILSSSKFCLRIVKDRGELNEDVSWRANEWHKLEYVLDFISSKSAAVETPADPGAARLRQHIAGIERMASDSSQEEAFRIYERSKTSEWLARIFPS